MKLKIMKVIVSAFTALMIATSINYSTRPLQLPLLLFFNVMDTKKSLLVATSQRLAAAPLAISLVGGIVFWALVSDAMSFGIYFLLFIFR